MSLATDIDRCMFFVGGDKAKSDSPNGISLAGGCTKEWWDAEVAATDAETAMGKLMGSDGQYAASSTVTHTEVTSGEFTGKTKLTGEPGFSGDVEAGMLLYHNDIIDALPDGEGVYKILWSQGSQEVIIDVDWEFQFSFDTTSTVYVGGAWADPKILIENYVDADAYTQEIWINKDLTISSAWLWNAWSGSQLKNTFMVVRGFHRVPGDVTETDGAFFQSNYSCKKNGVVNDNFVGIDLDTVVFTAVDVDSCANIIFQGFRFYNQASNQYMLKASSTGAFWNLDISGNVFDINGNALNMDYGTSILFLHNYLYDSSASLDSVMIYQGGRTIVYGNIFDFDNQKVLAFQVPEEGSIFINNFIDGEWYSVNGKSGETYIAINNTFKGIDNSMGGLRVNAGNCISLNNIIMPKVKTQAVYQITSSGGTVISKNDCVFGEDGNPLDDVMENLYFGGQQSLFENLLEVDPLLDSDNEPLEEQVRTGGIPDVLGDATSIGAIKTMNTSVIANAVWDEPLTGGSHNSPTSAGRRLRELASNILLSGISPGNNTLTYINLDGDGSAISGTYDPGVISIVSGIGIGQSRQIFEYNGPQKRVYINRDWKVIPDNTSEYIIFAHTGDTHVNEGVVTGSGVNTLTLNGLASNIDDTYLHQTVFIVAGLGTDQMGLIIAYNGDTHIATMEYDWITQPEAGSIYVVLPVGIHPIVEIQAGLATKAKQDTFDWLLKRFKNKTILDKPSGTLVVRNDADDGDESSQSVATVGGVTEIGAVP